MIPCSCGRSDDHVVARSETADGIKVELWHDGSITSCLGAHPPGVGRARGANPTAARLAWDDVGLYDWAEIGRLLRTARKATSQKSLDPREYLRRVMAGETFRSLKRGRVIAARPLRHVAYCPCEECHPGRRLPPGTVAGVAVYAF